VGCGLGGEGFWFGVGYYTCIVSTEAFVAYVNAPFVRDRLVVVGQARC